MDRNVVHQIRQKQVKGKEGCRQKKIIHWMKIVSPQGCNDEDDKEKEEQGNRCEVTDLSRQRAGLKFLRHRGADLNSRKQVLVFPTQYPASRDGVFLGGGKSILREINVLEVGFEVQAKIAHLSNVVTEPVSPALHSL